MNHDKKTQAQKATSSTPHFRPMYTVPKPKQTFTVDIPGAPKLTVPNEIPDYIKNVLTLNEHEVPGDFSVTELLEPSRCVLLKRKYPDVCEQSPASLVPCTAGKALHEYFAKRLPAEGFTTEELQIASVPELDAKLSGTIDAYRIAEDGTCEITDLKHKKTWAWTYRRFEDVDLQLNLYYHLLSRKHPEIIGKTKLTAVFLFPDWNRIEAGSAAGKYPPRQVMHWVTEPLPIEQIQQFITERMRTLMELQEQPEEEWPDPSPIEVYQSGTEYKVWGEGNRRASKTFKSDDCDSPAEAKALAETHRDHLQRQYKKTYSIRQTRGDRLRCSTYCPSASKCSTYQTWLKKEEQIGDTRSSTYRKALKQAAAVTVQDVEKGLAPIEALMNLNETVALSQQSGASAQE